MIDEKTNKNKLIPLFMIISGIIILILGITMVQTGFAGLDNIEPTIGLYIGGIFTIIGGSLLVIAGIITFFFDDLKKKYIRMLKIELEFWGIEPNFIIDDENKIVKKLDKYEVI